MLHQKFIILFIWSEKISKRSLKRKKPCI